MDEIHEFTNKMQIINLKEEVKKISKIVNGNVLKNISEKVRIFHNIKWNVGVENEIVEFSMTEKYKATYEIN